MTEKDRQQRHASLKTKQNYDKIFEFFRDIIEQSFASGSVRGVLPIPGCIGFETSYNKGLFSICFIAERREIEGYSPLIDLVGTIMLQQPDCAYFKLNENNRYALCGTWASPAISSQELKQFLKTILTPGHKVFSFSQRMKECLLSFLSRNARQLPKDKAIFRIRGYSRKDM